MPARASTLVFASTSFALPANVENLFLHGQPPTCRATATASPTRSFGNSGNNLLDGGGGADVINGGAGNDTYFVDNAGDAVFENAGAGQRRGVSRRSTSR